VFCTCPRHPPCISTHLLSTRACIFDERVTSSRAAKRHSNSSSRNNSSSDRQQCLRLQLLSRTATKVVPRGKEGKRKRKRKKKKKKRRRINERNRPRAKFTARARPYTRTDRPRGVREYLSSSDRSGFYAYACAINRIKGINRTINNG